MQCTVTTVCQELPLTYCLHSPLQAQSAMHGKLSLTQMQCLVMQPVLHPQRLNSGQHFAASGIVIHNGCHVPSTIRTWQLWLQNK